MHRNTEKLVQCEGDLITGWGRSSNPGAGMHARIITSSMRGFSMYHFGLLGGGG